jgi:hypothetical protein
MPPAAALSARIVPKGGEEVAGHFLPGGVRPFPFNFLVTD